MKNEIHEEKKTEGVLSPTPIMTWFSIPCKYQLKPKIIQPSLNLDLYLDIMFYAKT